MSYLHGAPALAPDVIMTIIQLATPPEYLTDPSLLMGPHSAWSRALRLKTSCSLVSRAWNLGVKRLLFRDVVLRRFSQVSAFVVSLESSSPFSATPSHVISLRLSCHVPPELSATVEQSVKRIHDLCPHLVFMKLSMSYKMPEQLVPGLFSLHSLTDLDLSDRPLTSLTSDLVVASVSYLASLKIAVDPSYPATLRTATFIHLDEFHVLDMHGPSTEQMEMICACWAMPSLTELTITATQQFIQYIPLVNAYGNKLAYLHLDAVSRPQTFMPSSTGIKIFAVHMQAIVNCCPNLHHLVLNEKMPRELDHPSITWVDQWVPWRSPSLRQQKIVMDALADDLPDELALRLRGGTWKQKVAQKSTAEKMRRHLASQSALMQRKRPRLRGIRNFDYSLHYLLSIPRKIPPGTVSSEADEFTYSFDGIAIRHDIGRVYQLDDDKDWLCIPGVVDQLSPMQSSSIKIDHSEHSSIGSHDAEDDESTDSDGYSWEGSTREDSGSDSDWDSEDEIVIRSEEAGALLADLL